jgi:hypothetical protein
LSFVFGIYSLARRPILFEFVRGTGQSSGFGVVTMIGRNPPDRLNPGELPAYPVG